MEAYFRAGAAAGLFLIAWLFGIAHASELTVTFPATHTGWILETPSGKVYVIDPGLLSDFYGTESTGGVGIGTWLQRKGITTIHGVAISHPHLDHFEAGAKLFSDFTVLALIDAGFNPNLNNYGGYTSAFWNAFLASGASHRSDLRAGDRLDWDPELTVRVLGPKNPFWTHAECGSDSGRHYNQNCLVLWVKHGGVACLFTGDITAPAQQFLGNRWPEEIAHTAVVTAPHHGRDYFDAGFAEAIAAGIAVKLGTFSEDHDAAGVAADILPRWEAAGFRVYTGDANNAMTLTSSGGDAFLWETTNPQTSEVLNVTGQEIPPPSILDCRMEGQRFSLTVQPNPGAALSLWCSTQADLALWVPVANAAVFTNIDGTLTLTDPGASSGRGFYRVGTQIPEGRAPTHGGQAKP